MLFETNKNPQEYLTDKTYLAGLLTGLVSGLAIGLLFAPRSGKKLRKHIAKSAGHQADELHDHWKKTKTEVEKKVGHLKSNAASVVDDVQDKAEELADSARDGFDKLKGGNRLF